ncbi:MAG: DUF5615 family PIN-like protein [Candidatus Magasanikbacteria bacterium]|nr:DUF5615 family PIN-like protein [Candidatus Magasanikbacteria bacterium]
MRLLVDANISYRLVRWLRQAAHDVVAVLEIDANASDEKILRRAVREKRSIITYDKDFGELIFRHRRSHWGVILLRVKDETPSTQQRVLYHFLSTHREDEIQEHFWILTDADIRRAGDI